jgi:hypothetical protein
MLCLNVTGREIIQAIKKDDGKKDGRTEFVHELQIITIIMPVICGAGNQG